MGASIESGAARMCKIYCQCCIFWLCIAAVVAAAVAGVVVRFTYLHDSEKTPYYSATITAVSGLDPETDLRRSSQALSPVFNLTVGVASHSRWKGARIAPGTAVKVTYSHLRIPMASGHVPAVSVGPRESRELPSVVASGRDVAVPGFLIDSLAEEMRTGQALFEVQLIESDEQGWWDLAKGWARVGDTIRWSPNSFR